MNGLRVAGGILFFVMGFEMLRGRTVPKRVDGETESDFGSDVAVTPIGIPMIALRRKIRNRIVVNSAVFLCVHHPFAPLFASLFTLQHAKLQQCERIRKLKQ
ncbi:hypothetical protein C9975_09885 [Thalassospira xiamenensis]|nr:hypothetical protein C9975_09885 [Thalassospira xiamenensis]